MSECAVKARRTGVAAAPAIAVLTAFAVAPAPALAQGAVSARDLQTRCIVNSIPNAEALTVSWTGECNAGRANGVGDVIAFSAGKLRYILRGQFRDGDLLRQENVRDCAGNVCADDVPRSLLRLHEQAAVASAASPPASSAGAVVAAPPVAAPTQSEVRAVDGVYRGQITVDPRTGALSGEVRAQYNDGRSFEGTLRNSRKEGFGTYAWPDGQRYRGQWRDDLQDGKGTLTFANGDVYEGDFVRNERTGTGTLRYKNGGSYTGQWLRGARDGRGVEEWPNGQRYDGSWKNNRKDGSGNMRFPDGDSYDGDWRDDRATGKGDILFASGDSYTGEVRDGVAHGQGIMRWGSGDRFEGEFDAGKPTARGTMTFLAEVAAASLPAAEPEPVVPAPPAAAPTATPAAPSRTSLCAAAFNAARDSAALKRFVDSFPDDECGRHALARQKIATWEEQARVAARAASKALEERQANARAFVGSTVAFRQEFPFCVSGTGASCQRVVYVFDVKAKVRDVDVQKGRAQVQISEVTSLGNEKGAPSQLFAEGRSAATADFRTRTVGTVASKTFAEVGLAGL